ncbi:hypothetical protein AVEN_11779-1 [Araneus ventricosus]|uniref:Uncharacterized protein n=1 Tax=Araneus ventricosus TaxID=182803 RepID=A0A4Y2QLN3_ARAVE|nr:hypothetical protein AVEN_11779-1 [Araneus ventricosus]
MRAGTVRILGKPQFSPNTSGRAFLTKKACAVCVKSITLNERVWEFQSDIRTFRTSIVFCLKERLGQSSVDRVKKCSELFKLVFAVQHGNIY